MFILEAVYVVLKCHVVIHDVWLTTSISLCPVVCWKRHLLVETVPSSFVTEQRFLLTVNGKLLLQELLEAAVTFMQSDGE